MKVTFALLMLILSITVFAEEKLDINKEVTELIKDVKRNIKNSDYSYAISELNNKARKITIPENEMDITGSLPQLYYFISFSIPDRSLRKAVEDAERVRAIMVLKGMKNDSMKETMLAIKEFIGEKRVQFQIDPVLFEEFKINLVPALVLAKNSKCRSCEKGKLALPPIFGDVSLPFALTEMKKHSPEDLKLDIERYLTKLSNNYYEN